MHPAMVCAVNPAAGNRLLGGKEILLGVSPWWAQQRRFTYFVPQFQPIHIVAEGMLWHRQ